MLADASLPRCLAASLLAVSVLVGLPQTAHAYTCSEETSKFVYRSGNDAYGTDANVWAYVANGICPSGSAAHTAFLKLNSFFHDYAEAGLIQGGDNRLHYFIEWRVYPQQASFQLEPTSRVPNTYHYVRISWVRRGTGFLCMFRPHWVATRYSCLWSTGQLLTNQGWAEGEVSRYGNADGIDQHTDQRYYVSSSVAYAWTSLSCDYEAARMTDWAVVKVSNTQWFTAHRPPGAGEC